MPSIRTGLLVLLTLLFAGRDVAAEIGLEPGETDPPNVIYMGTGYDYALFTLELGYARALGLPRIHRMLILKADFTWPLMAPDLRDYRVRLGARINAYEYKQFQLPVHLNLVVRGTENTAATAVGFGTDLSVMPGFYSTTWFLAAEVTWDQQWSTYIEHSDAYREYGYADAKDGWYRISSYKFRYGARIGMLIRKRVELLLRGGFEQDGKWDTETPPIYAVLGANLRL